VSSSYPAPSCAVPVSGGMVVAVPLELLASPLKNGRPLGDGDRSALVIGGTEKVRTRDAVVFCKVVAVAEAQVKRDGQVRAKGSPVHHATLGPLEERLEADAGPGVISRIAASARLDGRFARGERERLLAAAFMIRVIAADDAHARCPDRGRDHRAGRGPGAGPVVAAVAAGVGACGRGLAERAGGGAPGGTAGHRARLGLAGAPGPGLRRRRDHRQEQAAEGGVAGRDAAQDAGHAREQGIVRHRRDGRRFRAVAVRPGPSPDLLLVPVAARDAARPRRRGQGRRRADAAGRGHGPVPRTVRPGLDLADGPQLPCATRRTAVSPAKRARTGGGCLWV
jgi:hypothetical protein